MTTRSRTGTLLRFMVRRERRVLPWWLLGIGLMVAYQSVGSQAIYGTPEKLARFRETMGGNAAMIAMSGPRELLDTIGGEVVFELFAYLSVIVGLMNMFLIGRHTRSDEESGRAELLRSTQIGRRAPLSAALTVAALANLLVAVVVIAAAVGTGLPVAGSVLFGLALGGVGLAFAGLTAVAVQVFENPRAVYGAVGVTIGASFLLRAIGDSGNGGASWASPIGWGQRTFPYVTDRWWPLLLPLVAIVVLAVTAVALLDRRDFGGGLLGTRPGRPTASWLLGSPLGLAWRLQRGSLIGWTLGMFALGAGYGSFGSSIEQYIADNPEVANFFTGGAADIVNSYLALTMALAAVVAAAYGVASTLRARSEEANGRAEPVLATPTSRASWLGSHLTVALVGSALVLLASALGEGLSYGLSVADNGQISRLMGVALVYVPAMWLTIGVAALGYGWLPRAAAAVAWVTVGYYAVVLLFADSFNLPGWVKTASPFAHTPEAPFENVTATPLVAIAAIAAVLLAGGLIGFRRRDVVT